ncbi:MAG: peptidoglycan-binding domain-containing protein, partial [Pseudomonadota bacterium]
KLVRPAQERRIPIEATYRTLTKQRKVSDERLEWREILCETNTTPGVIRKVQIALRRAGYNPGGVDGVLGAQTISALRAYQVDQGLPSGQLTMATIRRLGVI